jgi:hypothetical protein
VSFRFDNECHRAGSARVRRPWAIYTSNLWGLRCLTSQGSLFYGPPAPFKFARRIKELWKLQKGASYYLLDKVSQSIPQRPIRYIISTITFLCAPHHAVIYQFFILSYPTNGVNQPTRITCESWQEHNFHVSNSDIPPVRNTPTKARRTFVPCSSRGDHGRSNTHYVIRRAKITADGFLMRGGPSA